MNKYDTFVATELITSRAEKQKAEEITTQFASKISVSFDNLSILSLCLYKNTIHDNELVNV